MDCGSAQVVVRLSVFSSRQDGRSGPSPNYSTVYSTIHVYTSTSQLFRTKTGSWGLSGGSCQMLRSSVVVMTGRMWPLEVREDTNGSDHAAEQSVISWFF